jgi:hypothetical protein
VAGYHEVVFRLALLKFLPFLSRWIEVAPACCGTCPTCAAVGVSGLTAQLVGSMRTGAPPSDDDR